MSGVITKLRDLVKAAGKAPIHDPTHKCDGCGKLFTGKTFPMVDSQHKKILGMKQCEKCYSTHVYGSQ